MLLAGFFINLFVITPDEKHWEKQEEAKQNDKIIEEDNENGNNKTNQIEVI